jgi:hypothetical protein
MSILSFPVSVDFSPSVRRYLNSPSTRFGLFIGLLTYASYGYAHGTWAEPALIGISAFVGICLPSYARLSNKIEEKVNDIFALITAGRVARFGAQLVFNLAALWLLTLGGAIEKSAILHVGGVLAAAVLTTTASLGAQFIGAWLFRRNIGDLNRNAMVGLSGNIIVTALATAGVPAAVLAFQIAGTGLAVLVLGIGILSDLRACFYPRRGVALFFGTFNPFHKSHLELVRRALEERRVSKVIVHPTILPKLHAQALERGEIRVARVENGLQVYEKTEKADVAVDYFPTGNRFLAPETRRLLIEVAVREAGLEDRVEVAYMPETYAECGFPGIVRAIRQAHPGVPLHGIHGSDWGGMLVRAILDECGWIYPMAVRRRDAVSATAIRGGARGMVATGVEEALHQLRQNRPRITVAGRSYRNECGKLLPA